MLFDLTDCNGTIFNDGNYSCTIVKHCKPFDGFLSLLANKLAKCINLSSYYHKHCIVNNLY